MKRRTIAAFTRPISRVRGLFSASVTACLVISLNETLVTEGNSEKMIFNLHAMNSPSRSGSVAMNTSFTPEAEALEIIFSTIDSALTVHIHGGLGSSPGLEAQSALELSFVPALDGKSCTWPLHASTIQPLPRYLLMVRAFAFDSRIISFMFPASLLTSRFPVPVRTMYKREQPI